MQGSSSRRFSSSGRRSKKDRDFKAPNLIPIMNLFIVIIPMLMTIMVSAHIALIEITLSTKSTSQSEIEEPEEAEEPLKEIYLALYPNRFELSVAETNILVTIPVLDSVSVPSVYDFHSLNDNLRKIKEENEEQTAINLVPDGKVKFDILLRSIDLCKYNGLPDIKYNTSFKKYYKINK